MWYNTIYFLPVKIFLYRLKTFFFINKQQQQGYTVAKKKHSVQFEMYNSKVFVKGSQQHARHHNPFNF